jgi:Tfp pilus assembly protein PilN
MRAVNLLPRDSGERNVRLPSAPVLAGICAGLLAAAVLGADFMMQSGNATKEQRHLDGLQAQVAKLPPAPPGPSSAARNLAGEHNARVISLSSAMATRVAWDRILREFSLVLPDDVWLTSLTATSPVSPSASTPTPATTTTGTTAATSTGSAPTQFSITGNTYSHDSVARLLARLQVVPDLQNVTLVSSDEDTASGQKIVKFVIGADIRTAGGSSSQ